MNWLLVPSLALAIALFLMGRTVARRTPRHALPLTIGLLLSVPGVLFFASYAIHPSWLSNWPWLIGLFQWRIEPASELMTAGLGFLAGLAGEWAQRVPELKRMLGTNVVPLLFVMLMVSPYLKPMLQPPPWDEFDSIWVKGVCKQSTAYSCGPCSVATLLQQAGVAVDEKSLAREVHCSRRGSEPWYLARALRRHGRDATLRHQDPAKGNLPYPAIAEVRLHDIDHVIAILGRDGEHFLMGDPVFGPERLTKQQLLTRYRFSGLFVAVR